PAIVHLRIGPRRAFEFPISKPELFGDARHAGQIVNPVMRDQDFVTKARIVVMPFNPVDHVTTVAGAGSADATSIYVGKPGGHRDAIADVGENFSAPVAGNIGDK